MPRGRGWERQAACLGAGRRGRGGGAPARRAPTRRDRGAPAGPRRRLGLRGLAAAAAGAAGARGAGGELQRRRGAAGARGAGGELRAGVGWPGGCPVRFR